MLRILICDDQPASLSAVTALARRHLADRPAELLPLTSPSEVLARLEESAPPADLALLDIDLGAEGLNGIELARRVLAAWPACRVVFISAYPRYAPAVYEVEHLYFVLKDELECWLPRALNLALEDLRRAREGRLIVSWNGRACVLFQDDIYYCERVKRTTTIVSADGEHLTAAPLDELLTRVSSPPFLRCHKSYVVNLRHVYKYSGDAFHLDTGVSVPISRSYSASARALFHSYLGALL